MPVNCLIKCIINSDSEQSCSKNQFMVDSWIIHEHSCFKKRPFRLSLFVFHPFVFGGSAAQNDGLSFFNTHFMHTANSLKTKDLRKRHFWLKFLSQRKPLRIKTLGENSPNNSPTSPPTLHATRRPKLLQHAPSQNPTLCKVLCRICRPNPTHLTLLIIKL